MIHLPNVTLVAIDTHYYGETMSALRKSLTQIVPAKAKYLTDVRAVNPKFPFEIVKIDKIDGKVGYSRFVMKELNKYIETDYVLIVQHDGYVLDYNAWDNRYLEYDYIGAPWLETDGKNVGNGGFSLRSKRLMDILATDDFIEITDPEDACTCRLYRRYLEEVHGIRFAPDELADKFSFELREPIQPTFGFHGKFHEPFKPTVIIKRSAAMGDIIATEPLFEYYHKKGYRVVIDAPIHFALLFQQHYFPIFHISQIDKRVPATIIDLDGVYEAKPKQLHLKSYYEAAGIEDGEIRNPKLLFRVGDHNRLFNNYVVIHIDKRDQPYRNIYGVNWEGVVSYLKDLGYVVIQIGQTEREEIKGAVYFNTCVTTMLTWLMTGAKLFIGIDSGPAAVAVACNTPSVIFFGSVNPEHIHPDLSNVEVVQYENVCDTPKCWSSVEGGTTGKECVVDKEKPPCTAYTTGMAMAAIKRFV